MSSENLSNWGAGVDLPPIPEHCTRNDREISANQMDRALKPRECWCVECEVRVTMNPELTAEYGHELDCEHHHWGGL